VDCRVTPHEGLSVENAVDLLDRSARLIKRKHELLCMLFTVLVTVKAVCVGRDGTPWNNINCKALLKTTVRDLCEIVDVVTSSSRQKCVSTNVSHATLSGIRIPYIQRMSIPLVFLFRPKNFTSAFPNMGYLAIRKILDSNNVGLLEKDHYAVERLEGEVGLTSYPTR
jgi:hypothetical protein